MNEIPSSPASDARGQSAPARQHLDPSRQRGRHANTPGPAATLDPIATYSTPGWLTIDEAASLIRVPKSWLYERTRTNTIPHVKLGKYLRFDRNELVAWTRRFRRDGRDPRLVGRRAARGKKAAVLGLKAHRS